MDTAEISTNSDTQMTCGGQESICVGDSTAESCTHNVVVTATCSEVANDEGVNETYIRIQNNGMPNHCWRSMSIGMTTAVYRELDFSVKWNPDVYGELNYEASQFSSESDTSNILCDL